MSVNQLVLAEDVRAGDDIRFLGVFHRVLEITEHPKPLSWPFDWDTYRVAHGPDDWTYALLPGQAVEVIRS